jgi:class 3 adenylate cyclase
MPFAAKQLGRVGISAALLAAIALITFSVSRNTPFTDADHWSYDFLVNHWKRVPQNNDLVFVDFDDASFREINQFPIPRSAVAKLIGKINEGAPKLIGLDIFLSEARDSAADQEMQRALTEAGNVLVASQVSSHGRPPVRPLPMFCDPEQPEQGTSLCKEGTNGAYGFALVNLPIDSDGFIRQSFLFSAGQHPSISFPLMLAQLFAGEQIKPGDRDHAIFLNHAVPYADASRTTFLIGQWNDNPVKKISATDVLDGRVIPAKEFSGKLVLIGQSNDAARDWQFTPVFRLSHSDGSRTLLSGTQVHAAAIATLLNGTAIAAADDGLIWILTLILCGVLVWFTLQAPLRHAMAAVLGAMIFAFIAAQLLFSYGHIWYHFLLTETSLALVPPVALAYNYVHEKLLRSEALADREQLMGLFSRYVSPEVAKEIWRRRDQVILSGEERVATVVFSDIRSFTASTAGKPSQEVLEWLNGYLTDMEEVISAESGFLNKFIGDGLMVLFGVPISDGVKQDARKAVQAAQGMLKRVDELNRRNYGKSVFPPLKIGIGIHTGRLTCGNVGSRKRMEYSVIGETVNLASRLESLTKDLKTEIVMSEATYKLVEEYFPLGRELGETPVRGMAESVRLFTIDREQKPAVLA